MTQELKGLQLALEEQRLSLDALHQRQAELSEENAALRDCLESIGILCGQAFLSRLHRRRFQRVLNQHPLPARPSKTLEVLTPELAVNIAAYSGPCSLQQLPLVSKALSRGMALCASQLDQLFPSTIYIIGGAGSTSNQPLRSLDTVRPDELPGESWSPEPAKRSMRQPRAVCSAVACGEAIYAIAGRGSDGPLRSVECYYPARDLWLPAPPLQRCSGWVCATGAWGGVFVAGGEDTQTATTEAVEFSQPQMKSWIQLPPMRQVRWAAAAACSQDVAFVAGGYGEEVLASVECLVFGMLSWQKVPPLLTPRAAHTMTALGGKLYVAGGYGPEERPLRSLERFDPHVGSWEALPCLQLCGTVSAACSRSKLYIFGGNKDGSVAVECFNPENCGRSLKALSIAARRCFAVVQCRA